MPRVSNKKTVCVHNSGRLVSTFFLFFFFVFFVFDEDALADFFSRKNGMNSIRLPPAVGTRHGGGYVNA